MKTIITLFLTLSCYTFALGSELKFDKYGGVTSIKGTKTGWIHTEQINGRWYFITPEGNAFFSLGVSHTDEMIPSDDRNLLKEKFNDDIAQLGESTKKRLKAWGYNSLGYGAIKPLQAQLPYVAIIETEGPKSKTGKVRPKAFGVVPSEYADIYHPDVQARLRKKIEKAVQEHGDNPYCIGYVFLDLAIWHNETPKGPKPNYVQFMQTLPGGAPGKKAYINFLKNRYEDKIDSFSKIYNINIKSFDELLSNNFSKLDLDNKVIRQDNEDFLNEINVTYNEAIVPYLRKLDPNHLVLGDRYMLGSDRTYDSIIKTASRYVDVLSYQPMGTTKMSFDYVNKVYEMTGKPSLMVDVNCVKKRIQKNQTDTTELEKEWSNATRKYYLNLVQSKNCIGIHRCTFRDHHAWEKGFYRKGLVRDNDTPYETLVENTKKIHEEVFDIVYSP